MLTRLAALAALAVLASAMSHAPAVAAETGQEFRDCDACPVMVVVPAGEYTMGSPEDEPGRDTDEGPQHLVHISRPFAVGKFEVTFAEWDACVADGGCNDYLPPDLGWGRGDRPVMNVSFDDVEVYLRWLSRKAKQPYRLLSESEWEYAARAGTTTAFSTGAVITTDQANFDGREGYAGAAPGIYRAETVPVGSFAPNAFGLYDMHGNVREWVGDCAVANYRGAPADGSATGPGEGTPYGLSGWAKRIALLFPGQVNCSRRVLRGGSWFFKPAYVRSANRLVGFKPAFRDEYGGFRVARSLEP